MSGSELEELFSLIRERELVYSKAVRELSAKRDALSRVRLQLTAGAMSPEAALLALRGAGVPL